MRLYEFDGIPPSLELLPLAARRALDLAGIRLGREGFRSLPHEQRVALVEAGEQEAVDLSRVRGLVAAAVPATEQQAVRPDPPLDAVPQQVTSALGAARPLPTKVWQSLPALARYSLLKVCEKGRSERIEAAYAELVGQTAQSTHLSPKGEARMVRVSEKLPTKRVAVAESRIALGQQAFEQLTTGQAKKGDVLAVARIAGIMATKKTSELIPLCHPLSLTQAEVRFVPEPDTLSLRIYCQTECVGPTGVEMEALVGASTAALTVYDMLKSTNRAMVIGPTQLLEKSGGSAGDYHRVASPSERHVGSESK